MLRETLAALPKTGGKNHMLDLGKLDVVREVTSYGTDDFIERSFVLRRSDSGKKYMLFVRKVPTAARTKSLAHKIWRLQKFSETMKREHKVLKIVLSLKHLSVVGNCHMPMRLSSKPDNPLAALLHSRTCAYIVTSYFEETLWQHLQRLQRSGEQLTMEQLMAWLAQVVFVVAHVASAFVYQGLELDDFAMVPTADRQIWLQGHQYPTYGFRLLLVPRDKVLHSSYKLSFHERLVMNQGQSLDFMFELLMRDPMLEQLRRQSRDSYFAVLTAQKELQKSRQFALCRTFFPNVPDTTLVQFAFPLFFPNVYARLLQVDEQQPDIFLVHREDFVLMLHLSHNPVQLVHFIFWRWFANVSVS